MKIYNLIYDKSGDLTTILGHLEGLGVTINQTFSSLNIINITSSEIENISSIEGIIEIEEDVGIDIVPSFEWHQLRVATKNLPMKDTYIPRNLGEGVIVYLMDSGITSEHSEFVDANIINLYSHDGTFEDNSGHGTAVASVIVGKTLGISPEVILKNVKIPMGQVVPLSSLLQAFDAIIADKTEDFAVINCSWSIPKSMTLDSLVATLREQGFLVVAAAGNTISNADDLSPVGYDAVLGVGASDAFDRVISWAPGAGSNWGKEVDVFAPGIDVVVANKDGGTMEASGTSISAGIVSAIAAQVICDRDDILTSGNKEITLDNIQEYIILNSQKDILFRNEEIYENTPNRLVMSMVLSKFYKNEIPSLVKINQGESFSIPIEINEKYVSRINIDEITFGNKTRHHPEWVILDNLTNTITISPPEDTESNYYKIDVEFYDHSDERLMVYTIKFQVGDIVSDDSVETYEWIIDENSEIIIQALFGCSSGGCSSYFDSCPNTIPNYKTAFCQCTYYGNLGECISVGGY